ncbi:MAG: recombinase, partial [Chloroflexi bacterium]|nr:recombinase [Chloroflexota bacterium]
MLETIKTKQNQPSNGKNGNGTRGERLSLFPDIVAVPTTIIKRDGREMPFDIKRIENALSRCFASLEYKSKSPIIELAQQAVNIIAAKFQQPTVEQVQDIVEMVLQAAGEYEAAKCYILYRAEHAKMRKERPIPDAVRQAFAASDKYFPTQLQKFQFYDKYSRFNYDLGRRETWIETVDRAVTYLQELSQSRLPSPVYDRIRLAMLEMRAMTSMRLLAMAGPAAHRNNIAIYNCSYLPVDTIDSFVEALIISMSGCGVGFSVESKYVENFPRVRRQSHAKPNTHVVEDSAEGWADSLRTGLQTWFDGGDIHFDLSLLRPAGSPLRIKGGRASGPEPLRATLEFARNRILARQGSFLHPIDAHDIMCAVGNAAVSGGMRRTAMISLIDFDDDEMRHAKDGDFERDNSQRWNANNSAVWPDRGLTQMEVMRVMQEMFEGGRGEPGIFNRQAAIDSRPSRRAVADFGTNPCGEIILRPYQFCNLSIAVARKNDTFESL